MWLLTYANVAKATPIIAEFPAHIPSIPSFRLHPLLTAITTKVVMRTKKIHPAAVLYLPKKENMSLYRKLLFFTKGMVVMVLFSAPK